MSGNSAKRAFIATLSFFTIGATLSIGTVKAEDVTEDQILRALARALTNPDLKGSTFIVAGHTDAAGGDAYNQELSERRADSIKRYLVEKPGISATDLVTIGYGKTQLKDPADPLADLDRRVQVANTENKATASK